MMSGKVADIAGREDLPDEKIFCAKLSVVMGGGRINLLSATYGFNMKKRRRAAESIFVPTFQEPRQQMFPC